MEIKGKVHCFFEQSGTFKMEFQKLGIPAEDYDIQNEFGQTDHVIDLFADIEKAFMGVGASLFDSISKDDLIMAFFPCIYFCENNQLALSWAHANYKNLSYIDRTQKIIERMASREYFYSLLCKLMAVVKESGKRLILENPMSGATYLKQNFVMSPTFIDNNRMQRGDYFIKPTGYWFVNCEPTHGMTEQNDKKKRRIASLPPGKQAGICGTERSMISPDYARNFICDFILGKEQVGSQLQLDF